MQHDDFATRLFSHPGNYYRLKATPWPEAWSTMSAAELEMSTRRSEAERLADFARVTTDDVDEAAEQIGRIFCPHDLKPVRPRGPGFSARHNCAAFDGFSINYVAYGGSVSIDPGCLERFFLVQVPLTGTARI